MTRPYRVVVSRQGALWNLKVVGIHGEATTGDLSDAERIARKFISLSTGAPLDGIRVEIVHVAPAGSLARVARTSRLAQHRPSAAWRWVRDRFRHAA